MILISEEDDRWLAAYAVDRAGLVRRRLDGVGARDLDRDRRVAALVRSCFETATARNRGSR